jgi:prepilin-type N-terminal cleavage/methylation domain-containing protein
MEGSATRARLRGDEWGFTLPELLVVIAILGILLAIAMGSWLGVVEGRRVDSATNQLVSDLRLAHTSATNQLASWEVRTVAGSGTYQLVRLTPPTEQATTRTLPDGTEMGTTLTVRFAPDGSAATVAGSGTQVSVASDDGSPSRIIQYVPATSRVRALP